MVGRVYGQEHSKNLKLAKEEAGEILDRVGLLERANVLAKDLRLMERKRLELAGL
jgi:ABC-type branched-subunit amino acid transport system ATPase component